MSQAASTSAGQVLESLIDGVRTLDVDKLRALVHPDVVAIEPPSLPYGKVYEDAEAFFGELLPAIVGPFDLAIGNDYVMDGGDVAAVRMDLQFTSKRTGESITMPYVEVYRVTDGLVTKIEVFPHDVAALATWMEANG